MDLRGEKGIKSVFILILKGFLIGKVISGAKFFQFT